jgi:DNA-binding transcriptional MocR family regulator
VGDDEAIESGNLPPGTRLENEVLLADQLGLSRPTMRRAMQYLVDRGLLVRKRGIGTQVARAKFKRPVELSSLWDDLARSGQQPATKVMSISQEPVTGEIARKLGLPAASWPPGADCTRDPARPASPWHESPRWRPACHEARSTQAAGRCRGS